MIGSLLLDEKSIHNECDFLFIVHAFDNKMAIGLGNENTNFNVHVDGIDAERARR